MQEKLRKFRQFRPVDQVEALGVDDMEFGGGGLRPGFNAREWWGFAYTCIVRSFQFKRGAIKAFKMTADYERQSQAVFNEHMSKLYGTNMDDAKRRVFFERMEPAQAKLFWHVVSQITQD